MQFRRFLKKNWEKGCFLSVGLDTDYRKIPRKIKKGIGWGEAVFEFNKRVIRRTRKFVCAYKINAAFYEKLGKEGTLVLKKTVEYIKKNSFQTGVILDFKRGDIENTNKAHGEFAFDYLGCGAVTVNPYLGRISLRPFLERKNKGIFVICKTSNRGSGEFQDARVKDKKLGEVFLYELIAYKVSNEWNKNGNCGLVVGGTYTKALERIRKIAFNLPILIPGIGAQGGDLEKSVKAGLDKNKKGIIISISRSIIYPKVTEGGDFEKKVEEKAKKMAERIKKIVEKNG